MTVTYAKAGVSIAAGDRVTEAAKRAAKTTRRPEVVAGVGGFGALFSVPKGYKNPLIVTATDGVGTKLKIAFALRRHDTVGIDLVAMNVNDILTLGAEPVAFLDYIVTDRVQPKVLASVLDGIAEGCRQAGCALIGGETAEHPGAFTPGEYDLAGFTVGVVERQQVIDGKRIVPGDLILGLPSSGLHSNGFSLVRHLLLEKQKLSLGKRLPGFDVALGEELLRPTRIYVKALRGLPRGIVKGMAHITGGGITGNLTRAFPKGCSAVVRRGSWPVPAIFDVLQRSGPVATAEMYRTFNMGIGLAMVVAERDLDTVLATMKRRREAAYLIGEVTRAGRRAAETVTYA